MKKKILLLPILSVLFVLSSLKVPEGKKDMAIVNQVSGLYIYLESRPANDYESIGTVKKTGFTWSGGKPKEMLSIMTRRAKDDYPNADGIIFDDITMDHATVIKFK